MKAWISSTLTAVVVLAVAATAQAKPLSRILAESGLSPDDFNVLSATTDALLAQGTLQVGSESEWVSTETESKGTVRIIEIRENCVQLMHFIRPGGADKTREIRNQRCQDASGAWIPTP